MDVCIVKYRYICGLSLIEVMISLSISLVLLMILLHLYLQNRQSINYQNKMVQLNHEVTITSALIREDIHQAGYMGCPKLTKDFPIVNHTKIIFDSSHALRIDVKNHLVIQHAQLKHAILYAVLEDGKSLRVSRNKLFKIGDILLISDCMRTEIIQVLKVTQHHGMQEIMLNHALHYKFSQYAEVARLSQHDYFLQSNHLYVQTIKQRVMLMSDVDQFDIYSKDRIISIQLSITKPFKKKIFIDASKNIF